MGKVINKQGMFIVRMAKNVMAMPATKRIESLNAMHPKVKALVTHAIHLFDKKNAEG